MSTKREENCPECGAATLPKDNMVLFEDNYGKYPVRQWRYECACGWSWANEVQRENNHKFHKQARRARQEYLRGEGVFW